MNAPNSCSQMIPQSKSTQSFRLRFDIQTVGKRELSTSGII